MSSYIQMIKAVSGKHESKIKRITEKLFNYLNLNSFWYNKITDQGTITTLVSHMRWTEYFASERLFAKYPLLRHSSSVEEGARVLKDVDDTGLEYILDSGRQKYGMQFLFSVLNKTNDGIEEFGFASLSGRGSQISAMYNELPLLRLFVEKLKEENKPLFFQLEDNKIDITELIGADFYKSSFLFQSRYQNRSALLNSLGVLPKFSLNVDDVRVLQLILNGCSASQIAQSLFRSKRTVEHRVERIKEKLSCYTRAELWSKARELERIGYFQQIGKSMGPN